MRKIVNQSKLTTTGRKPENAVHGHQAILRKIRLIQSDARFSPHLKLTLNSAKRKSRRKQSPIYFDNRSTNTAAESFNAKIKAFKAQFRGVRNLGFFLFRLTQLFA